MPEGLSFHFPVTSMDFSRAGDAASKIKKVLRRAGFPNGVTRKAAIVAYEAEMNLVIHSVGGELSLVITPTEVKIRAVDKGPGIPDVRQALEEGFSTAPDEIRALGFGAGMGLSNIRRNSDEFEIHSLVKEGTDLRVSISILTSVAK